MRGEKGGINGTSTDASKYLKRPLDTEPVGYFKNATQHSSLVCPTRATARQNQASSRARSTYFGEGAPFAYT